MKLGNGEKCEGAFSFDDVGLLMAIPSSHDHCVQPLLQRFATGRLQDQTGSSPNIAHGTGKKWGDCWSAFSSLWLLPGV